MKFNYKKLSLFLLLPLLTSCGSTNKIKYDKEDYRLTMEFKEETFVIEQITDLHYGSYSNIEEINNFVKNKLIDKDADLLILTGDSFLSATKNIVDNLISLLDEIGIPYAFTYGNHDLQGIYHYYYINEKLMESKVAKFIDYKDDDLDGLANYYIDLVDNDKTYYRLYIIDSNSYYFSNFTYKYDVIHDDQLEFIKEVSKDNVKGLAFFHIPLVEYVDAYNGYKEGKYEGFGDNLEASCIGYKNNGAFDIFKEANILGTFVGHDHLNYSSIDYNGMILSYGVKSSKEIYNDDEILGYKKITLNKNEEGFSLSNIENVFLSYE